MKRDNVWHPDANIEARVARLARQREERCASGVHEDPDNSGQCIHCGAVFSELREDDG